MVETGEIEQDGQALDAAQEQSQVGSLVKATLKAVRKHDVPALRDILDVSHEADIADMVALLASDARQAFVQLVGEHLSPEVLAELDEGVRAEVAGALQTDTLVAAVKELETDDAVFVLGELGDAEQKQILDQIPESERVVIQRSLDYPDESAGRLMRSDMVAVPPFWTIGQTIDYLRETEDLPDDFHEILVVDPSFLPVGVVQLNRALRSARPTKLVDVMDDRLTLIPANMDREDMARQFERFNLVSAPVVEENGRLVGVVTADDVFEVIVEEAEEDILLLGGVGDEAVTDTVFEAARGRFSWLFVNLMTAILASLVISVYEASLQQMVALAVLMPIVASMGGNAGTQTLTITVRALATMDLMAVNAVRVIMREVSIALINGLLFAVLMGLIGAFWFDNVLLGWVLAVAMIVNMLVAGLSGILIPIGLNKAGVDPALASSVFVTTITDVFGFFAFLGFATWILI
ncbi:MAG: magnesium transporter [Parvibaculales bacterium]